MNGLSKIKFFLFVKLRIWKYQFLSSCNRVVGKPILYQPLQLKGNGRISFGKNIQIGVINSPGYYSNYCYIEARTEESEIIIDDNVALNNGFSAVALTKITIKKNVLIGINCSIVDNDGHNLDANQRLVGKPKSVEVFIDENVFLGNNVTVLKGVMIGKNSVIGNGSVVTKNIPENVIAAGNPAKIIRNL